MYEGVAVRDVMSREFVGVSESDSLTETASLLLTEGSSAAVVLRGGSSVGLFTERDALSALANGVATNSASVSDVMRRGVPAVRADSALETVVERMRLEDVRWLVVESESGVEGLVTETDLLTAVSLDDHREPAVDSTVKHHEGGSICQGCGTFTRDLLDRDGDLLCPSCRAQ